MDRPIIEVGELPCAEDFLFGQKAALYGLGMMASAAIGPGTGVAGLAIAPTVPASLSFTIGQGSIYEPETVDATAYGVLGTDANTIIKQGILAAPVTLTVTPPSTSGFSQVYLVQVGYSDVDGGATLVPFYNSLDPTHPSSSTQNTIRQGALVVQLKAGTAASTGSQVAPSADPGFTGIWAVTVANGATTITIGNWKQLSTGGLQFGAPWFPNLESLYSLFMPVTVGSSTTKAPKLIGFAAHSATPTNVGTTTATGIVYNAVDVNNLTGTSSYSTSTSTMTVGAGEAGLWLVQATLHTPTAASTYYESLSIFQNGTNAQTGVTHTTQTGTAGYLSVSRMIQVNVGDTFFISYDQQSGSTINTVADNTSTFSAFLVSSY